MSIPQRRVGVGLLFLLLAAVVGSCDKKGNPVDPGQGQNQNSAKASAVVTGVTIAGQKTSSGFAYTVTIKIQGSGNVGFTVNGVELTFTANGATIKTATANSAFNGKVGANGSATSAAIAVADDTAGNPYATHLNTKITFTDDNGNTGTATGSDDIASLPSPPSITSFSADKTSITTGQSATLQWNVNNATTTSLDNGIGSVNANGTRSVSPSSTTTYTLSAANNGGSTSQQLTISVNAPPPVTPPTINSFSSDKTSIQINQSVTLNWSTSNATGCTIDNGVGNVGIAGPKTVQPPGSVTYTLTASNAGGTATRSVSISASSPSGYCAANTVGPGVTAVCNDNTTSSSQNRSGTCSSHGGVKCWVCPGVLCDLGTFALARMPAPITQRVSRIEQATSRLPLWFTKPTNWLRAAPAMSNADERFNIGAVK